MHKYALQLAPYFSQNVCVRNDMRCKLVSCLTLIDIQFSLRLLSGIFVRFPAADMRDLIYLITLLPITNGRIKYGIFKTNSIL